MTKSSLMQQGGERSPKRIGKADRAKYTARGDRLWATESA